MSSFVDIHDNDQRGARFIFNQAPQNEEQTAVILKELLTVQNETRDALIADAIDDLRHAIERQDKDTVSKKLAAITSGTAKTVLAPLLVAQLKTMFGL